MINKEEIIELASNFKFRSREYNLVEKLGDYYLNRPKLDNEVGEAFNIIAEYRPQGRSGGKTRFKEAINLISKALSDKDKELESGEQTILKMLDIVCKNDTLDGNLIRLEFLKMFENNVEKEQILEAQNKQK